MKPVGEVEHCCDNLGPGGLRGVEQVMGGGKFQVVQRAGQALGQPLRQCGANNLILAALQHQSRHLYLGSVPPGSPPYLADFVQYSNGDSKLAEGRLHLEVFQVYTRQEIRQALAGVWVGKVNVHKSKRAEGGKDATHDGQQTPDWSGQLPKRRQ